MANLKDCSLPALSAFDHIQTIPFPVAPRLGSSFPKPRTRDWGGVGVEAHLTMSDSSTSSPGVQPKNT